MLMDVSAAKRLFRAYNGNKYLMAHDDMLDKYKQYSIEGSLEHDWRMEMINENIEAISKDSVQDNASHILVLQV